MDSGSETLRRVLALAESDEAAAWLIVQATALRAALRVGRRFRLDPAACEDLAHDATLVAVKDGFAALRRRDPDTPLAAWLTICVENLARARRRREHRGVTDALQNGHAVARAENEEESAPRPDATADVAALVDDLTTTQRRLEEARLDAGSERKAAKRLGASRHNVFDVHRREIAEALGITATAVRGRVSRAHRPWRANRET